MLALHVSAVIGPSSGAFCTSCIRRLWYVVLLCVLLDTSSRYEVTAPYNVVAPDFIHTGILYSTISVDFILAPCIMPFLYILAPCIMPFLYILALCIMPFLYILAPCKMWYPHDMQWQVSYCVFNSSNEGWLFMLTCRIGEYECFFNDTVVAKVIISLVRGKWMSLWQLEQYESHSLCS